VILLLRHGETEWNVARRLQGRCDSPLTERGRRQARAVASLVADLVAREAGAWRLVSSPLGRARATAAFVAAATGLTIETDDRLMEVDCGAWEGRDWTELVGRPGEPLRRARIFDAPGAESHAQVRARLEDFLATLPPEPDRRAILISHGVTGRVLRAIYMGLPSDAMLDHDAAHEAVHRLQNGQVDRFDCEPID
jgi:probable phosphoglycerate mutase